MNNAQLRRRQYPQLIYTSYRSQSTTDKNALEARLEEGCPRDSCKQSDKRFARQSSKISEWLRRCLESRSTPEHNQGLKPSLPYGKVEKNFAGTLDQEKVGQRNRMDFAGLPRACRSTYEVHY